ncbi:hypothetical protein [Brachybacterium fresconis]|uniref:Uncharacterized protein YqgC (DUF456 family) n=1 Tax=Brachybacterium fresconis TaxID=173363 RepID=A0ABS4YM52_9MICO|nr:hypothetical protein [Brachybacterium fresconis]MBP2409881.1 uncharacterized protein YqgC (DUF456 family) [Brachybacterium fresconis]
MSGLTTVLFIVAGILLLTALVSLYLSNVTFRKSRGVSRWVIYLSSAGLLVAVAAVLTAL